RSQIAGVSYGEKIVKYHDVLKLGVLNIGQILFIVEIENMAKGGVEVKTHGFANMSSCNGLIVDSCYQLLTCHSKIEIFFVPHIFNNR
ncbi:hypothetical protein AA407_19585, partial [Vibrio anguillarum]|nr:hypothetical protein [Vibrio anguillarum]